MCKGQGLLCSAWGGVVGSGCHCKRVCCPWQAGLAKVDMKGAEYRILFHALATLAEKGTMLRSEFVQLVGDDGERLLKQLNLANITNFPPPDERAHVTFHSRAARWYVANAKLPPPPPPRWWSR